MILYIDTSDAEKMTIVLGKDGKVVAKRSLKAKYKQAEKLLPVIDAMLNKKQFNPSCGRNWISKNSTKVQKTLDIEGIAVVKGPGPFTALRIGVATANALSYSLDVPVIGITSEESENTDELICELEKKLKKVKKNSIIEPEYGREPNITKSKKSY